MPKTDSEVVKMTPNVDRILAAIFHVITAAKERNETITQYDVVKAVFLADRSHLNEWGRPITYDNYVAMVHGPVPTLTYDLLKANANVLRRHHIHALPWTTKQVDGRTRKYVPIDGASDPAELLSPSDIQALDDALGTVKRLGFGQVRRLTHEDPAYIDAWQEGGEKASYDMKLELLFEEPNFEQAQKIAEYSPYV